MPCPYCGRLFVLRTLKSYRHEKVGKIDVHRCQGGGREAEYVECQPPGVV